MARGNCAEQRCTHLEMETNAVNLLNMLQSCWNEMRLNINTSSLLEQYCTCIIDCHVCINIILGGLGVVIVYWFFIGSHALKSRARS